MQKTIFSSPVGSRIRPAGLPNQATWAPESSPWVPQISFCEPPNQAPANPRIRPLRISNETQTLIQTPRHTESQTKRHIHTHIHTHTHTKSPHTCTHVHAGAHRCRQNRTKTSNRHEPKKVTKSHRIPEFYIKKHTFRTLRPANQASGPGGCLK
jgi:hypothetical protein